MLESLRIRTMAPCPCGSNVSFIKCCKPFLSGKTLPKTAEQLMRSRYSAYTRANIKYISDTQAESAAEGFNAMEAKQWALSAKWLGLKVLKTEAGQEQDKNGKVEFVATYKINGTIQQIHELSEFKKIAEKWMYVAGSAKPQ
jgi:SEC-C motif-containing protein